MKRAGNLFPGVVDFSRLVAAAGRALRGSGRSSDAVSFHFHLEREILVLKRELEDGCYRPGGFRRFTIRDPKPRTISVAPFRDRVVHHAVTAVLEPVFEPNFDFDSYASRKGKGAHAARKRAQAHLRASGWYLKCDVEKFFETVNHAVLTGAINRKVKDRRLLALIGTIVTNGGSGGTGLPIGNLTSQFFANVYLDSLDRYARERIKAERYVRYMDDFILFHNDTSFLADARSALLEYTEVSLLLKLKYDGGMLNRSSHGLGYLGANIFPAAIRVGRESLRRTTQKMQRRFEVLRSGGDEKKAADSLASMIAHIMSFDSGELRRGMKLGP